MSNLIELTEALDKLAEWWSHDGACLALEDKHHPQPRVPGLYEMVGDLVEIYRKVS